MYHIHICIYMACLLLRRHTHACMSAYIHTCIHTYISVAIDIDRGVYIQVQEHTSNRYTCMHPSIHLRAQDVDFRPEALKACGKSSSTQPLDSNWASLLIPTACLARPACRNFFSTESSEMIRSFTQQEYNQITLQIPSSRRFKADTCASLRVRTTICFATIGWPRA